MAVNRLCSHTSSPRRKRAPGRTRRATLLAIAALVGAIPAASPAHAALSDSELLTAGQQMAIASGENAQAQIEMTRDFLEAFADNLSTLAESGHLLNDFSGIQLPDNASPAARAFFNKIGPAQNWLAAGGHEGPDRYALLSNIYDLIDSVHQDLDRPASTPLMAVLSSHTLEKLGGIGLDWISDNGHLQDLLKAGKISAPFAKYAGFLAFGADDLVAGAARLAGGANWQDPETATHLVDALNRGAWAAVGFLVSGGNAEVAKIYSDAANLVASVGRKVTLDAFVTADMQLGGAGAAILDEYIQAQNARLAHN